MTEDEFGDRSTIMERFGEHFEFFALTEAVCPSLCIALSYCDPRNRVGYYTMARETFREKTLEGRGPPERSWNQISMRSYRCLDSKKHWQELAMKQGV